MLQAHSLLWHYLWVAPSLCLFVLGLLALRRDYWRQIPAFVAFALVCAPGQLSVYAADVIPSVSPVTFWRVDWANLCVETLLKFFVLGEVFSRLFNPYPSISKFGKRLVSAVGALFVFVAAAIAAMSQGDSTVRLISGAHLLELTVFIVQSGLILSIFLVAAYFHMPCDRFSFGILLGFGFASCIHLATWAAMTNLGPSGHQRTLLDFANMAAYHVAVVIWFYYLLVPHQIPSRPVVELPENHLSVWNRELERLIHQ
jgi:hypothetical protein